MQNKINFLIDECVLGKTKDLLEKLGFSIITLQELKKLSASNGEVLSLAEKHKAVLVTNDLDFSNLILYPLGSHLGVVVLRFRSEIPEDIDKAHEVLKQLFKEVKPEELQKALTIIDLNKYRIRRK